MKLVILISKRKLCRKEKTKLTITHSWRNNKQNKIKIQFSGAICLLSFKLLRRKRICLIMKLRALVWAWPVSKFLSADKPFCVGMLLVGMKWWARRRNNVVKWEGLKAEKFLIWSKILKKGRQINFCLDKLEILYWVKILIRSFLHFIYSFFITILTVCRN